MICLGIFKSNITVATIASLEWYWEQYILWLYRRVIFGEITNSDIKNLKDLNTTETIILSILAITSIFFGFYPDPLLSTTSASVENLIILYDNSLKVLTVSNL